MRTDARRSLPTLRTLLELVRIPNVFSAPADSWAGYFFVGGGVASVAVLTQLAAASACLYAGGMVLNDAADAARDARERSKRPIPSGRVSRLTALVLAAALLAAGVGLAGTISARTGAVSTAIVAAVVLYDVVLKRTRYAPAMMGLCRALNILLGMSVLRNAVTLPMAIVLGCAWLYITSVTIFARTEARTSSAARLKAGAGGVMVATVGLLLLPLVDRHTALPMHALLVAALIGVQATAALPALASRKPALVQKTVKIFLLGWIVFDALVAGATGGDYAAALVAALLIPAVLLSRRFKPT